MRLHPRLRPGRPALLLVLGLSALASPAFGQATEAQTSAIRSNCRSDFISHCAGVKTGGVEAFQCLKKNEASLSAGCRAAVDAISAPAQEARPAAPAHPAPAAAAPAPPPPAASAPATPHPAVPAPKATEPKTAPAPKAAAAPETAPKPARKPTAGRPGLTKPAAAAPTAQPPAAMPAPKIDSPQEARLIRRFCFTDFKVLCAGVKLGQGRALQCLAANAPSLSPGCRQAMAQAGR